MAIRLATFAAAVLALYGHLQSFHLHVPLLQVLGLTPFVLAIGNAAFTPAGIGTTQIVFVTGFAHFAARSDLRAVSLAATALNFAFRVPLALVAGPSLPEKIAVASRELKRRTHAPATPGSTEWLMVDEPEQSKYTANLTVFHKKKRAAPGQLRFCRCAAPLAAPLGEGALCARGRQ
jgi:hypothetical protein